VIKENIKRTLLSSTFLCFGLLWGCSDGGSVSNISSSSLSAPVRIATASTGQLVVTEYDSGQVVFLNPDTLTVESTINTSTKLTAVGASSDKVLVGSDLVGAVGAYSYDGELLFTFGSGVGEFVNPNDLTIDESDNRVYVVDTGDKVVKVYGLSDGAFLFSFGSGQMNFPTAIAFDPSTNTLLISDFGVGQAGGSSLTGPGSYYAGIWRYDLVGNYIETITGSYSRPQGLAVDTDGTIFLVDSLLGQVLVYRKNVVTSSYDEVYRYGAGDGLILKLPLDIVIDPLNKDLYVTNSLLNKVEQLQEGGRLP
jgi:DNA-binding beta-propeller fold protein YncE